MYESLSMSPVPFNFTKMRKKFPVVVGGKKDPELHAPGRWKET
jgi:hypothetical protein